MEKFRPADNGPNSPVSWCMDKWRNVVKRYENPGHLPRLTIEMDPHSPVTEAEVEAWYWDRVGTVQELDRLAGVTV